MRGPPVVLTDTLGRPVTNVISERGAVPMTVVNTLGEPVTLVASGGEPVTLFNENGTLWDYPFSLFSNNEQGAWYDPSDFSTLYQNAAGTTPVTAVEQPVRLMLDRSKGLVLGAEAVSAGVLAFNPANWNAGAGWTANGNGSATFVAGADQNIEAVSVVTSGITYRLTITVSNLTTGSISVRVGNNSIGDFTVTANGSYTLTLNADGTSILFRAQSVSGTNPTISGLSVRELPGNHATAPNDASRPVLRARYNLLTYTEQFDNAAWTKSANGTGLAPVVTANAAVAPDGTMTADSIVFDRGAGNASGDQSTIVQLLTIPATGSYTGTVYLKAATAGDVGKQLVIRHVGSAAYLTVTLTADWVRHTRVETTTTTSGLAFDIVNRGGFSADNTVTALVWGASLLTAADQAATGGAYQRIAAATDYDTSNPVWRPYLAFDGSDDSMSTSAIDFSGTDEVTLFAGVTKLDDVNVQMLLELSADLNLNNGTFWLAKVSGPPNDNYDFISKGTLLQRVTATGYSAPITNVFTGLGDISGDRTTARLNGAQVGQNTGDQGTGNYGNYPLFIGRRNNTSLPFNGRLYGLTVLGRTATAAELGAMEAWVAGKTGVSLP